jgi:acetolactate synthase-1/2/3 large subunit
MQKMSGMTEFVENWDEVQRPVILMGAGARKASSEIIAFAERFDIPIVTTWNAIDTIGWEHPNFIGRPGIVATRGANFAVQRCDWLLSIGARLAPLTVAFEYERYAPNATKVLVDIDRSEALKIPDLDIFVQKDSLEFIQELDKRANFPKYTKWLNTCRELKTQYGPEGTTATFKLCETLSNCLTPEDVIVFDNAGSAGGGIFPAFFKQKQGQRVIMSSCGLGSMGSGIPAAIGVSLASNRRVILIEGDGSFCQCIQELEVIKRLNLNIIMFVINNGGYASIRNSERRAFGRIGEGTSFPDISEVAKAFGIQTELYKQPLGDEIGPKFIEVDAEWEEDIAPRVIFDGRGSLEDMAPYK